MDGWMGGQWCVMQLIEWAGQWVNGSVGEWVSGWIELTITERMISPTNRSDIKLKLVVLIYDVNIGLVNDLAVFLHAVYVPVSGNPEYYYACSITHVVFGC